MSTLPPDALLNRTAITLARSRRIIDSWLPASSSSSSSSTSAETAGLGSTNTPPSDIDDLKSIASGPEFERVGLGAVPLSGGGGGGGSELEKLRRRLLGAGGAGKRGGGAVGREAGAGVHGRGGGVVGGVGRGGGASAGQKTVLKTVQAESESEEEGRASAVGAKKKGGLVKGGKKVGEVVDVAVNGNEQRKSGQEDIGSVREEDKDVTGLEFAQAQNIVAPKVEGKKRPASYLDELLSERSEKKKKKKKKKGSVDGGGVGV